MKSIVAMYLIVALCTALTFPTVVNDKCGGYPSFAETIGVGILWTFFVPAYAFRGGVAGTRGCSKIQSRKVSK